MRQPGIYEDIDIDVYHSEEGISSTGISLILNCPKKYHYEYRSEYKIKEDPKSLRDKYLVGRAFHMRVLEPDKFWSTFLPMDHDVDLRTKSGKEDYAIYEGMAKGKKILRCSDFNAIDEMYSEVILHPIWDKINGGKYENSIYWDSGLFNTRLKARPDYFNDDFIIDLKTTDSIEGFKKSIKTYGYHRQAAMQIDGLMSIDGKRRHFGFFVVEKKAPFLSAAFYLDEAYIEAGRRQYEEGAAIYSECMSNDVWPGYDTEFQMIEMPAWDVRKEELI